MNRAAPGILSFSTLFPNRLNPLHGLFVERRLLAIARRMPVHVIAPVNVARTPRALWTRLGSRSPGGLPSTYPRFLLPRPGFHGLDGAILFGEVFPQIRRSASHPTHRLVDAHYAYPDGAAAARLARALRLPYVLTVRGSDLEVLATDPARLPEIRSTLAGASAVVAVSESLARKARELGAAPASVHVIPNGVDTERFHPMDRRIAREKVGLEGDDHAVLFVGALAPVKGLPLLIEAMAELRSRGVPRLRCLVVGSGPERAALEELVRDRALGDVMRFVGPVAQDSLTHYYAAADALCLTSRSEGCPNVVLEALACGTPIVATSVGGIPELLAGGACGILVPDRSAPLLADALARAFDSVWDPAAFRRAIAGRTWDAVARSQIRVYERALDRE